MTFCVILLFWLILKAQLNLYGINSKMKINALLTSELTMSNQCCPCANTFTQTNRSYTILYFFKIGQIQFIFDLCLPSSTSSNASYQLAIMPKYLCQQISTSVEVFSSLKSASLNALSRLIPGEHTTAMLSKPPLHTLRQRNTFEVDWKNKRDSSCNLATSFSDSSDSQPTITCRNMWMFLTSSLTLFIHYSIWVSSNLKQC